MNAVLVIVMLDKKLIKLCKFPLVQELKLKAYATKVSDSPRH